MARFKLTKIETVGGGSIVRVRKVHFKIKPRTFVIALTCAVLVWLYVKGSAVKNSQPPVENTPSETTTSEMQTDAEPTGTEALLYDASTAKGA